MNKESKWLKNELSSEMFEWDQRDIHQNTLTAFIAPVVIFGVVVAIAFIMVEHFLFVLTWGAIVATATGVLRYATRAWGFNFEPKKIKWSEEGIRYISRVDKEYFIPWRSVTVIEPIPSTALKDKKIEDYRMFWKMGLENTAVSKEIGIKLKEAWEEYKSKSIENNIEERK